MFKRALGLIKKTEHQSNKLNEEFEEMSKRNQISKNKIKNRIDSKSKDFEKRQSIRKKHFDIIHSK